MGTDRFRGGGLAKANLMGATGIHAAIDDGLLDIPFKVVVSKPSSSTIWVMPFRWLLLEPVSRPDSVRSSEGCIATVVSTSLISEL